MKFIIKFVALTLMLMLVAVKADAFEIQNTSNVEIEAWGDYHDRIVAADATDGGWKFHKSVHLQFCIAQDGACNSGPSGLPFASCTIHHAGQQITVYGNYNSHNESHTGFGVKCS